MLKIHPLIVATYNRECVETGGPFHNGLVIIQTVDDLILVACIVVSYYHLIHGESH